MVAGKPNAPLWADLTTKRTLFGADLKTKRTLLVKEKPHAPLWVAVAVALVGWQRRRKQGSRGDDVGWRCVVAVALGMVVTSGGDGVDGGYGDGAVARLRWWGDHDGGGDVNALKERNVILEKEQNALDVKVTELETSVAGKER
ncbi:hypothetical protein Tco_1417162, partial [Tanacetum coccineum]